MSDGGWRVPRVGVRDTGAGIVLPVTCACPGGTRRPPIRLRPDAVIKLHGALAKSTLTAALIVMTYQCPNCRSLVEITAGDLHLIGPST